MLAKTDFIHVRRRVYETFSTPPQINETATYRALQKYSNPPPPPFFHTEYWNLD